MKAHQLEMCTKFLIYRFSNIESKASHNPTGASMLSPSLQFRSFGKFTCSGVVVGRSSEGRLLLLSGLGEEIQGLIELLRKMFCKK